MIPPLYKFRSIDNYTLESLREGYLYFSTPTTFNDPFEFLVYLCHETTPHVMKGKILEVLALGNPDLSECERDSLAENLLRDGNLSKAMEDFRHFKPEHNRQVSVYCMTSKRDVILQWVSVKPTPD